MAGIPGSEVLTVVFDYDLLEKKKMVTPTSTGCRNRKASYPLPTPGPPVPWIPPCRGERLFLPQCL